MGAAAVSMPTERRLGGRPSVRSAGMDAAVRARRNTEPWESDDETRQIVADHPEGMALEDIGDYLGYTKERIRQIEAQALRKLRLAGLRIGGG